MPKAGLNLIGGRVKQARRAAKHPITQHLLSKELERFGVHIDRAGIAKIEAGIRGVLDYEVVAFARALNVKATWLLGVRE